jgi:hypothetical protein
LPTTLPSMRTLSNNTKVPWMVVVRPMMVSNFSELADIGLLLNFSNMVTLFGVLG